MEFIKDIRNVGKKDIKIAGGKGSSLGELMNANFNVPKGYIILTNAFEEFTKKDNTDFEIDLIIKATNTKNINSVQESSKKICALILTKNISRNIKNQINKSYDKLNTKFVAIRSSATYEDSINASWAGQLNTYLNTTKENLIENIKKCWASLYTPRALLYRAKKEKSERII